MTVSLSQASFVGLLLETFALGIFLLVFGISTYFDLKIRHHDRTLGKKIAFGFSIVLCFSITTHWVLNLWGCYDIYMNVPRGALTERAFRDVSEVKSMIRMSLYEVQVWMGDAILIFRLYYVCGRKLVTIIFPCITCLAVIVCSGNFLHALAVVKVAGPHAADNIRNWCIGTLALTFAENLYCASMIASHIWRHQRNMRTTSTRDLSPILRIFVESAGMWILIILVNLIIYVSGSNVFYVFLYPANPVLGISFCLMTLRFNVLKRSQSQTKTLSTSTMTAVGSHTTNMTARGSLHSTTPAPYIAEPVDLTNSSAHMLLEKGIGSPPDYNSNHMV